MSSLQVADYPRSQYEVYWEKVPANGYTVVRFYGWETGELVEENEVVGDRNAVDNFIVSRMAAYRL